MESQLGTTGNLNLLAGDTVRVRDSVTNPFVAQAGGQLLVQGKQGVDIFALNHPSSGLVSGGDLVLRSLNTVGGDAHYWAGGNFRIEKLDGSLGGLFSPYDPIIRASGDVRFASYTGGSLHILAGGSVTIPGTIRITGTDGTNGLTETTPITLSDGTAITIDGKTSSTLDIRAGTNAFGSVGLTPNPILGIVPPNFSVNPTNVPTNANIQIGSIFIEREGQVFLTNQYVPNTRLGEGSINQPNPEPVRSSINITGSTLAPNANVLGSYSIISFGTPVTIDARGDVNIAQGIITGTDSTIGRGGDISILSGGTIQVKEGGRDGNSSIRGSLVSQTNGSGGDISLTAARNITTTGDITSEVILGSTGNGGNITLTSNFGEIDTRGVTVSSRSSNGDATTNRGRAGNVRLTATGDIRSGNINATSNSNSQSTTDFAEINLNSLEGTVFLNGSQLNTTNTGTGFAGNISINGKNIQIDNSRIESLGYLGQIFIGIDREDIVSANNVTISNSSVSTTNNRSGVAGDISINGSNIQIGNSSKIESLGEVGRIFIGIDQDDNVSANNVTISNSSVRTNNNGSGDAGDISINGRNIQIDNSRIESQGNFGQIFTGVDRANNVSANNVTISNSSVSTNNNGSGDAGDISINGRNIQIDNSRIESQGDRGRIFIGIDPDDIVSANNVTISNSPVSTTNNGSGFAGDISISGRNNVKITGNRSNDIVTNGYLGTISITSGGNVDIRNSELSAQAPSYLPPPTTDNQRAGDIEVTSQNGKIDINNSSLFASTGSKFASAGSIELTARRDAISITNNSNISSRILNSQPLTAGSIQISTDKLTVENSEVTVSSELAQAGNLNIDANKIFLNKGILRATTGSNIDKANIFLQGVDNSPLDLLHLQNESLIAADANNSTTGGNVTINTKLLIALPPTGPKGSDITANAAEGKGGEVTIAARPLGIYGIEYRQKNSPFNDITASSERGPAGIVSIDLPDVDPKRGLFQLPEDLRDSARFIDPSCPVGGKRARSRFVETGGGGLPPNPGSALNSDILLGGSRAIATPPDNTLHKTQLC